MIESNIWIGKITLLIFSRKVGWLVGLGQEEVAWGWGQLSKNTLKGARTEKRGGEIKFLKKGGGKLSQGVAVLKRGEAGTPLTNYHIYIYIYYTYIYIHVCTYEYMHHNLCFNLFLLDNNSFDNQGSKINKNNIL